MIVINSLRNSLKTLFTRRSFQHLTAAMLLVLVLAFRCAAQSATDGSTPVGLTSGVPAGSYPLSDFDNINLFNGNLNFSLPLLHIAGRGGVADVVQLKLERKWHTTRGPYSAYPNYNGWQSAQVGYGIGALEGRVANGMVECGQSDDTLLRLTFTAPDGTEYELRDQLTNGAAGVTTKDSDCATFSTSRGRVFKTSDGSAATFISDVELTDGNGAGIHPSGYLLLRDGTRYRIDAGKVTWQRDRNGNQMDFAYNTNLQATQITDSLGRVVTFSYYTQPAATPDKITYTGFGGTSRSINIWYSYLNQSLRSDYGTTAQSYHQLFPELSGASSSPFNPPVISSVELPDGRRYYFRYNLYGELARVELPTGGAYEYDYQAGLVNGVASGVMTGWYSQIYRRVVERRVYPDGGTGSTYSSRMTVSRPEDASNGNTGFVAVEQRDAAGTLLSKDVHYYYGSARESFNQAPLDYARWKDGKEWKTESYASNGTTLLRSVEHTWQQPGAGGTWPLTQAETNDAAKPNNPQVTQRIMTLVDTNQVTKERFAYDQYSNKTDTYQYDYGTGAPPTYAMRHTHTDYLTSNVVGGFTYQYDTINPNTTSPDINTTIHLRSLQQEQFTYSVNSVTGAETLLARTKMSYDEDAYPLLTYGAVTQWNAPGTPARGNLTSTGRWLDTAGGAYLWTHNQYDQCGSMRSSWDANGKLSQVSYASTYAYAYPTTLTSAVPDPTNGHGSNAALVGTTVYDFYSGLVTSTTDANLRQTSLEYNDVLDRLTKVNRPDGGWTSYGYGNNQYGDYVYTQVLQNSAGLIAQGYQFFDKMGRPSRSFQYVNSDLNNPWLTVDKQYDALGRMWKSSSPYMSTGSNSALNPSGNWIQTAYDGIGRVKRVTTPDSAIVTSSYSGNSVTVTDQQGKARQSITDGLGNLSQVIEDPGTTPTHFNYQTTYTYDVLGNLRRVQQGTQNRYFMYDSLSRLVRANNPEQNVKSSLSVDPVTGYLYTDGVTSNNQWSNGYTYDAEGNLVNRIDARTTTTFVYDALNRLIIRSYDDGTTPAANFYYDTALNGKGRLAQTITAGTNNSYLAVDSYDVMGRPLSQRQEFLYNGAWSQNFYVQRTYDMVGHTKTQTYPSGHTVNYTYDSAGRLADYNGSLAFNGNLGDGVQRNYSSGILYNEWGMKQEQFGTTTPVFNKLYYNSRGQLSEIRESTIGGDTSWNRGAIINQYAANCWACSGPDNNGNLQRQEVYIPNNDQVLSYISWYQAYSYDNLNRLKQVSEVTGVPQSNWQQAYTYDQYGNRTIDQANTTQVGIPHPQFTIDAATNRLYATGDANHLLMSYDTTGNLANDSYTSSGSTNGLQTRVYDAENFLTSTPDNQGGTSRYTYDANGRRVRRQTNGTEVWQVYGIDGELVSEYAASAALTSPQKEYGYRKGELLITAGGTNADIQWLVSDQLGTPRMIMDQSGSLAGVKRHDYLPFGEELSAGTGLRTSQVGYTVDAVRQKFTGYESDAETGLDYAQARYYSHSQGRFTTVDPLLSSGNMLNPQSWNRYSYVSNRPLTRVDPSGLFDFGSSLGGDESDADVKANVCAQEQCTDEEKQAKKRPPSEVKRILDERQKVIAAINMLNDLVLMAEFNDCLDGEEYDRLKTAVKALGTAGDHNGVTLESARQPGDVFETVSNKQGKSTIYLENSQGVYFAFGLAHEGQHVRDVTLFVRAKGKDLTQFEYEVRGFETEGIAAKAYGKLPIYPANHNADPQEILWNKKWAAADIHKLRRSGAIFRVTRDYPGLSESHQGKKMSEVLK